MAEEKNKVEASGAEGGEKKKSGDLPCCLGLAIVALLLLLWPASLVGQFGAENLGKVPWIFGLPSAGPGGQGNSDENQPPPGAADPECADKIINEAKLWKDTDYGGCNPSSSHNVASSNMDCSCFVKTVIKNALNVSMPRLANQQADPNLYQGTKPSVIIGPIGPGVPDASGCLPGQDKGNYTLDFSKLQKGDILFWDTGSTNKGCNGITHVGIYTGDGATMWHSGGGCPAGGSCVNKRNITGNYADFKGAVSFCRAQISGTLQQRINATVRDWKTRGIGSVGISIQASENASYSDRVKYIAASVIKVYVAVTTMKKVEQGNFQLNTVDADLRAMLNASDNDATNRLIDRVGGLGEINSTIRDLGFSNINTIIQRRMGQPNAANENYTNPADINATFKMLEDGTYINAAHRTLIKNYLTNTTHEDALGKVRTSGVTVIHKIGSLDSLTYHYNVDNDAGIINTSDQKIYISVFSNYNTIDTPGGFARQDAFIAAIAQVTVDYFKEQQRRNQ